MHTTHPITYDDKNRKRTKQQQAYGAIPTRVTPSMYPDICMCVQVYLHFHLQISMLYIRMHESYNTPEVAAGVARTV